MLRKVLKLDKSRMIVLPKEFCEKNNIDFGDFVEVFPIKMKMIGDRNENKTVSGKENNGKTEG